MPIRIAHVISTRGMGGAERFLADLAVEGHRLGHDQVVLNPFANEQSAEMERLCHPVPYAAYPCDRVPGVPGLRRWVHTSLRQFAPDIVHVMLFQALAVTATLPKREGWLLTHVYGDWASARGQGRLVREVDRRAGARFDRIIAISESVRGFLLSDYGYPASKVTCIPLGWKGDPKSPVKRARPPTIVCVAAFRPEKEHEVLLEALSLVRRKVPDVRLVLIGDGERRPAMEAKAATDGLTASVAFLRSVPEVWSHLADADVFAIASQSEAFGIAIAEAMAAGLPVVAPAAGAVPELVRPGVTGELFRPRDHEALARHLVRLLTSPEVRSRMSAAARAGAAPLRMECALEKYFAVYRELAASAT